MVIDKTAPYRKPHPQTICSFICVLTCALMLVAACAPPTGTSPSPAATPAVTSTGLAVATVTSTTSPHTPTTHSTTAPTPSSTSTATVTTTPTAAATATATPTSLPTPSPTSLSMPLLDCPVLPAGSFLVIWESDPGLQSTLGCPFDPHPRRVPAAWQVQTAYQPFERGEMIWSDHVAWYPQPVIYVLYADSTYSRLDDTFDPEVDPIEGDQVPPPGLTEPAYGFGKAWRDQTGMRERLGWATSDETPGTGYFQMFLGGNMVWISQTSQTYVFLAKGSTVHVFNVPFSVE